MVYIFIQVRKSWNVKDDQIWICLLAPEGDFIKCLKKPSKLHLFLVLSIYFNVLFRYSTFVMRVSCLNRRRIHPPFEPTINK